jgi:TP901-1 family phage major tail protein
MYVQGKDSILFIKWDGLWVPISCETSNGMSESAEMINTTTRDNKGWTTSRPNSQSYSISFSGQTVLEAGNNILNYYELVKIKRNRLLIEWQRRTAGRMIESGMAYINNISNTYETEGIANFDMSLEGFANPRLIDNEDTNGVIADYDDAALVDELNNAINTN